MSRNFSVLFFFCFFSGQVHAQNLKPSQIDSLWKIWENTSLHDTVRLYAIHDVAWKGYTQRYPDSAKYFANMEYEYAEQIGSKKFMAAAMNTIGLTEYMFGNLDSAIHYFNHALIYNIETNNKKGAANNYNNLGLISYTLGNYAKASEYYNQTLLLRKEIGDINGMAAVYNNIGTIYRLHGDYEKGLYYYQMSLNMYQQTKKNRGLANVYGSMANLYSDIKNERTAVYYFLESIKLFELENESTSLTVGYNNLGLSYRFIADSIHMAGDTAAANDYYYLAISYFQKSLDLAKKINQKGGEISATNNLGILYHNRGNFDLANEFNKTSLKIASEIGDHKGMIHSNRSLYRTSIKSKNFATGFTYLNEMIRLRNLDIKHNYFVLPENEKSNYFSVLQEDFDRYFDFVLNAGNLFESLTDSAYNLAIKVKGLSLKSSTLMRTAIYESEDSVIINLYENWIALKKEISDGDYNNDSLYRDKLHKANEMEQTLIKESQLFSEYQKLSEISWKNVQAALKEGEAAIEFLHFRTEFDSVEYWIYAALIITHDCKHPIMIKLCNDSELSNIFRLTSGNNLQFVNEAYGTKRSLRNQLYNLIWKPMELSLKKINSIYYSPSGLLHKISLAAICKEQDVFLSDVYNFHQMGSTGNLAFENKTTFGTMENFLLMGGVSYNSQNSAKEVWTYLPGSLHETESINSFLMKKKFGVNYFHSNNASEEIFKEKIVSSSIVHIATHGFFFPDPEKIKEELNADSESNQDLKFRGTTNYANWSFVNNKNPLMRSGIVLANANDVWERDALANGEDGILTAQEVSNLDLRNTKLVVLSACETGLGDIKGSEGVFGLQRAFKMAGVKYLIMSLWQVPDKETSEFMQLFYKNLLKLKDVPAAFQKTQKVMRKKYDPYYWGAFVLIE